MEQPNQENLERPKTPDVPPGPEGEMSMEEAENVLKDERKEILFEVDEKTQDLIRQTEPAFVQEHIKGKLEAAEAAELGDVGEEAEEAKTELVAAVAERKGPPPITPEMKKEFEEDAAREKQAEAAMDKARHEYAEAAAKLRQFEGATGKVLGFLKGNERKMLEAVLESAKEDYDKARGELVEGRGLKFLEEKGKLADKIAEERGKEKGWLTKVYDTHKKFGEINASKWNKWPKGDKWQKVGKMLSVRTGISVGLLAGGTALTLGGAQMAAAGTMLMRRVIGGGGASVGSYDLMRMVADRSASDISIKDIAKEKGLDKKQMKEMKPEQVAALQKEAATKLEDDELLDKLDKIELQAMMGGKKTADNAVYQLLQAEVGRRFATPEKKTEGEPKTRLDALKTNLGDAMKDADKRLEDMKKKRARNDMIMKGVAGAIGVAVASGTVAKGIRLASEKLGVTDAVKTAKEFYVGKEAVAATVSEPMPTVTRAGEIIPPKEIVQPPEFSKETLAAATVQRGEGYTQVIARQLESRPQDFGFDPGRDGDVHKWAARMSREIAKDKAIIGKNGEWRLNYDPKKPSAIVLERDNTGFHLKEMDVDKKYKAFAPRVVEDAGATQRKMDAAFERVRQMGVDEGEVRPDLEGPPDVARVGAAVEVPAEAGAEAVVEKTAVAPPVEVDRGMVEDAMRTVREVRGGAPISAAEAQKIAEHYVSDPNWGKNYSLTHIVNGEAWLKKGLSKDALMQIINDPQQGYDENRSAQWALKQMGVETGIRGGSVASGAVEVAESRTQVAAEVISADGRVGSIDVGGVETRFKYDAAGNVTGLSMDGEAPGLARRAEGMLGDGWRRLVSEKAVDANAEITMVEGDVRDIQLDRDTYNALVQAGKGSSLEAKYLLQSIDTKTAMLKQQYGDAIFRGAGAAEPTAEVPGQAWKQAEIQRSIEGLQLVKHDLSADEVRALATRFEMEPAFGKNYRLEQLVLGESYVKRGMTKEALMQIIGDPKANYDENRAAQWALGKMGVETGIRGGGAANAAVESAAPAQPDVQRVGAAAVERPAAEVAPDAARTAGPVYTENQQQIAAGLKGADPAELRRVANAPAIEGGKTTVFHSPDGKVVGEFGDGTDLRRAARLALQQMGEPTGPDKAMPPVELPGEGQRVSVASRIEGAPGQPIEASTGVQGFENAKLPFEQRINALGALVGEGKTKAINGIQFEMNDGELRIRMPEDHFATPYRGTGVGMVEVTPGNIEAVSAWLKMPAASRDFFILDGDKLGFNDGSTRGVNPNVAAGEVLKDSKWLSSLNAMRRDMANRRLQMLFGQTRALKALNAVGMGNSDLGRDLAKRVADLKGVIADTEFPTYQGTKKVGDVFK